MNQRIPATWASCEIGEIADVIGGATPPSKDITNFDESGGIPWITPADLSGYKAMYISRGARNLSEKGFAMCSAAMLPSGAVLFSSRAPIGYVAIAANSVCTNQGFKSFVLADGIDSRFVYFYLRFIKPLAEERATGTTFKELSGAAAARLPLTVAPTNEQKRIADKLDAVLTQVDACRERLDRVPAILKRFRQAVLAAATSGKLTERWRETRGNDGWLELQLNQVAVVIDPNPSHRYPSYDGGTVSIISTEQFEGRDGYNISRAKLVNASFYEGRLAAHGFRPHDIVFARKGRLGLARRLPELEKFVFSHTIFIIRAKEPSHSIYLLWYLRNDDCIDWLLREMNSNQGVPTLGKSFMERLPVRLPPIEEQHEIVRRVEALFAYADRLEARYTAAYAQVERLTPALLAKAFSGGLVPQDPNDEPASLLLERIRAVRAASAGTVSPKRRKGGGRPKTSKKVEVLMLTRKDIQDRHLTMILKDRGPLTAEALWSASQLDIDDFYDQLKDEEARGLLREKRGDSSNTPRILEAA